MVPRRRTRQGRERALGEPALGPVNGLLYYLYARDITCTPATGVPCTTWSWATTSTFPGGGRTGGMTWQAGSACRSSPENRKLRPLRLTGQVRSRTAAEYSNVTDCERLRETSISR